jgi:hypothetical protein
MRKVLLIAIAVTIAPLFFGRADAVPLAPQGFSTLAPASNIERVYYRGRHVYVGPRGRVVVHGGPYRVGGRYYGGVWYGHARRWYGGRWWPYGVGECWAPSPIGFVWTCG